MENQPIVKEFLELVQIDAYSGDERAVADALKSKLVALGFEVKEDDAGEKTGGNAGNLIAVLPGTLPGSLLFSSHMDRVQNGYGIKPRIEGGRIVSGGDTILAADDLSGAAAILDGVRRVLAARAPHPRLEVVLTVSEEAGLVGSRYLDFPALQSELGFALDSPGRLGRVINAAPSSGKLKFEVFGKAAHAGNAPEKGVNALVAAGKILANIRDGRLDPESTANFALCATGGKAANVVCDYVCVEGETRSRSQEKFESYLRYFEEYCPKALEGTGATVKTSAEQIYRCFDVPHDSKTIRLIRRVFDQMGVEMLVEKGGGGMDANRFNEFGIPCVGLATGYFANHSNNEYIELEDLARSGELVERLILEYPNL